MTLSSFAHAAAGVLVAPAMVVLLNAPAQAAMPSQCGGLVPTIVGTYGNDELIGTDGDDVIVGGHGNDQIRGLGGNDVVCGNGGKDQIDGGDGADHVYGRWGDDTLSGGPGDDVVQGGVGWSTMFVADAGDDLLVAWSPVPYLDFSSAPQGVTVDLTAGTASGWGQDTFRFHPVSASGTESGFWNLGVRGSAYDDTVLGSPNNDTLVGQGGTDTIEGRGGDDYVFAGVSDDRASTDRTADSLDGGDGNDTLFPGVAGTASGDPGNDSFYLQSRTENPITSDLSIAGGEGRDWLELYDNAGAVDFNSSVYQHVVFDLGTGSLDADTLHLVALGFENFYAGTVYGSSILTTSYDITGTDAPNILNVGVRDAEDDYRGTLGTVVLHGLGGDDKLQTSSGDDTIDGGPGTDTADAGRGNDTCTSIEAGSYYGYTNCEVLQP